MKITDRSSWWLLGLLAIVLQIPHSMAPWGNGNYPTDICVYLRCAEWLQDGLVMYRDMFDHKGPLVYMIYEAAVLIGPVGVWILDILLLYLSLVLVYRMARLFAEHRDALLIAALTGCYMQLPFTDEGSPEWLAMPGCIYCCYLLAKRLKDRASCSVWDIMFFTASVAICLCTKPNTCAGMIPIAGYIVWQLIRHFEWRVLGRYCLGVILGLSLVLVPVGLWIAWQGNGQELIDAYWTFNTSAYGPMTTAKKIMGYVIITLVCLPGFYTYGLYCKHARKNGEWWFISGLFFFTVLLNAYLKNGYPHYVAPCMAVFALVLSIAWPTTRDSRALYISTLTLFLAVGIGVFGARSYLRLTPFDTTQDEQTAAYINAQTDQTDYVMACDVDDRSRWGSFSPSYSFVYRLWLLLDAKPASPYFYLPPSITPEMRRRSWDLIEQRMPKWVVCTDDHKMDYIGLGYTLDKDLNNDFYILRKP